MKDCDAGDRDFLRSYAACRSKILDEKIRRGEVPRDTRLPFEMFFGASEDPHVFFLDEGLTKLVYVHDACPALSFFVSLTDEYSAARSARPHFNCQCETLGKEIAPTLLGSASAFSTSNVGAGTAFWDAYGEISNQKILSEGEAWCEDGAPSEMARKNRAAALVRRMKNKRGSDGGGSTSAKKTTTRSAATYFPWQEMTEKEWDSCAPGEDFFRPRLARRKHEDCETGEGDSATYRSWDKILRGSVASFEETDLARLVERDERHFLMAQRKKEWKAETIFY